MLVRDMMQTNVVTIAPDASLAEAQACMRDRDIRHLPVMSDSRLMGMISDRDLRGATLSPESALTADKADSYLTTTPVEAHMTTDLVTSTPDTDASEAAQLLLSQKIGSLPVVQAQRLVGIVTEIDLLREFMPEIATMRVSDCMQPYVIKMRPEDHVTAVWQLMCDVGIRHIPVIDDMTQLLGIITDRDVRSAALPSTQQEADSHLSDRLPSITVAEVMTQSVHTVQEETPVAEAGRLLLEHKFGCLPVVNSDNTVVGLLATTDLLRFYVEQQDHLDST